MTVRPIAGAMLALALTASACGGGDASDTTGAPTTTAAPVTTTSVPPATSEPPPGGYMIANVSRRQPDASADDVAALAAGNRAFAADLYAVLAGASGDNLAFSPLSIRIALAMTYAGAEGTTAVQMADALRFGIFGDRLHAAYNALDQALEARNAEFPPGPDGVERSVELAVVNALWGQQGFSFEDDFLRTLAAQYGAGMHLVDYVEATEAARAAINEWVASETSERIPELIGPGVLSQLTRLVLTNAVYLDATWASPFDPDRTRPGDFTLLDGSVVSADLMRATLSVPYAEGENWQAVELPYVGDELAMLVIVPDAGAFPAVEASIAERLEASDVAPQQVALALPRFEFRSQSGLVGPLRELGMVDAFDTTLADFSGMTGERDLFISDILHEAFIAVDEQGTEAAAATAVVMDLRSAPADPIVLEIDRPFLFALRDRATGTVLFLGRVLDPTA